MKTNYSNNQMVKNVFVFLFIISMVSGKSWIIGENATLGSANFKNGMISNISGSAAEGLGRYNDELLMAGLQTEGDAVVTLDSISNVANRWGVTFRTSGDPSSEHISLWVDDRSLILGYRSNAGELSTIVTLRKDVDINALKMLRTGDKFHCFYKADGDSSFVESANSYRLKLPFILNSGFYFAGLPVSSIYKGTIDSETTPVLGGECFTASINFEEKSFAHYGVTDSVNWNIDSNKESAFTTSDTAGEAILTLGVNASRMSDPLIAKWDVSFDGVNCGSGANDLYKYTLFAKSYLQLGSGTYLNATSVGSDGNVDFIDGNITNYTTNIEAGNHLNLGSGSYISGDIIANTMSEGSGGNIKTGKLILDSIIPAHELPLKEVIAGNSDFTISTSQTLVPGKYGDVIINDDVHVDLSEGNYSFRSLIIGERCQLNYVATKVAAVVDIAVNFEVGKDTHIGMNTGADFNKFIFYTNQTSNVNISDGVFFSGYLIAPKAKINFGMVNPTNAQLHGGGIYADSLIIFPNAHINKDKINDITPVVNVVPDRMTATFHSDSNSYSVQIESSCENGEEKSLISLIYDHSVIVSTLYDQPIVADSPVRFRLELYPSNFAGLSNQILLYADFGTGYKQVLSTTHNSIMKFNAMTVKFKTSPSPDNNSATLDNISFSCSTDSCADIQLIENPRDTSVYVGAKVMFRVKAVPGNASYQWFRDPWFHQIETMASETTSVLVLSEVSMEDRESHYFCKIKNDCDSVISTSGHLRVYECKDPIITQQPVNCTTTVGQSAYFSVIATGPNLKYQWIRNGKVLVDDTLSSLIIDSLKLLNNFDEIKVRIYSDSSDCGQSILSSSAYLYVEKENMTGCLFLNQPQNDTLEVGERYITNIATSCTDPEIQWYINGLEVSGQTDKRFISSPLTMDDSNSVVHCVIRNNGDSLVSNNAVITVIPPRTGNHQLSISGSLSSSADSLVGSSEPTLMNFIVSLYNSALGGTPVYTEKFVNSKSVVVENGDFTVVLGKGKTDKVLENIIATNSSLYAEIKVSTNTTSYEVIGLRLPLNNAPYAMSGGSQLIEGKGSPITNGVRAEIGSLYIDTQNSATWKKASNGWKRID